MGGVEGGKYGPMGEDLFAQSCLDAMGVRRGGAFDTVLDGACEADRPVAEKKNKKWKPDCTEKNTAAYHPFMKVGDYVKCYEIFFIRLFPTTTNSVSTKVHRGLRTSARPIPACT